MKAQKGQTSFFTLALVVSSLMVSGCMASVAAGNDCPPGASGQQGKVGEGKAAPVVSNQPPKMLPVQQAKPTLKAIGKTAE